MDRKRMHPTGKLLRQRRIDHAMPLQAALSAEGFGHNIKTEVGLAAGPVAGVALVLVRFIFDMQTLGREGLLQFFLDYVLGSHGFTYWVRGACRHNQREALTSTSTTRRFAACQVLKPSPTQSHNPDR